MPGRLLVVQPSTDEAFRVRCHVPDARFLATAARARALSGHPVVVVDLDDPSGAAAAVQRAGGADGITCLTDDRLEATALLAAALGLSYHTPDVVRLSRRKDRTLRRWRAAGIPAPATAAVDELPDLLAFGESVEPPWILKPIDRGGSEWVLRVDRHTDLADAHRRLCAGLTRGHRAAGAPRYIAQELVAGQELSADVYVADGHVVEVLRWTEKLLVPADGLAGLVGAYYPARLHAARQASLRATYDDALRALGIKRGIVMVDGILRRGTLHLLEVGLRPGGDCLPDLCRSSSGYDPVRAACQTALGRIPDGPRRPPDAIAALHLMADRDGTISRLDLDAVRSHPAVVQVCAYRDVGDRLRLWPGSYDERIVAACLARFDDSADLPALLQELSARTGVRVIRATGETTTPAAA